MFHQKYEKVLKNTQNVPKTVDNHKEQSDLGLGYQFQSFWPQKGQQKKFKIRNLSLPTTKMLKKPLFFTISSPKRL